MAWGLRYSVFRKQVCELKLKVSGVRLRLETFLPRGKDVHALRVYSIGL